MTSHRPPVLVATAAAVVLAGVCFMPSASAAGTTADATATPAATATPTATPTPAPAAGTVASGRAAGDLADTGAVDTTPYLVGGSAFLLVGAALVTEATRRGRRASRAGADLAL